MKDHGELRGIHSERFMTIERSLDHWSMTPRPTIQNIGKPLLRWALMMTIMTRVLPLMSLRLPDAGLAVQQVLQPTLAGEQHLSVREDVDDTGSAQRHQQHPS